LLNNAPRAASVVADSNCEVIAFGRAAFNRLLGGADLLNKMREASGSYGK